MPDAALSAFLTASQFRAAIAAVLMTILLGALDQTIVSVAVPTIARQLGGFEWMAWVVSGYLIASTVVTPLYGRFSDQFGRRAVMSVAITVFLLASVACALAQTLPQLVLARVLQGIGGGGLLSMAQSVVADVVPMRERGRYQSYISIVWAVASVAGPVMGGLLTQYLSWPWIFWINLPVGLLALALVRLSLASLPVPRKRSRIDVLGVVLLLGGLTALLIPITRVGLGLAWHEAGNLGGLALAAVLLAGFLWHEQSASEPILPMELLRERSVVACCALLFVCFFLFIALAVLVPLRLQLVVGLSAAEAAVRLLPLTLGIPIAAFASGRWTYATGQVRPALRAGVVLVPLALAATALVPPSQTVASSMALALLGIGFGLQMPTTLITAQHSVPREVLGTVTALTSFFRLLGGAVGVAVLSASVLAMLHGSTGVDAGRDAAFRTTLLCAAAFSALGIWCAQRLPEVRLHGEPSAATAAVAAE